MIRAYHDNDEVDAVPKTVDHEERRREIAEAVVSIAGRRGLQAASMREVAAEAGVSLRLVQYYFHTKEELLLGTLRHLGNRLVARVDQQVRATAPEPTPRTVLYATLSAIIPTDDESRRILTAYAAFFNLTLTDPHLVEHSLGYGNSMETYLADKIREGQRAGEIRADLPADDTAAALFTLTNGLGLSVLVGQRDGEAAVRVLTGHLDRLFAAR
jgi:AcrR family transcriptional regulator